MEQNVSVTIGDSKIDVFHETSRNCILYHLIVLRSAKWYGNKRKYKDFCFLL